MDLADVHVAPILIALLISMTDVQSQILKGPANALRKFGDSNTLECVTSSRNCDQVEWMKMEGAQSSKTVYRSDIGILDGFSRERYNVSSTGGCNLTITQLQISDSGRFTCLLTVGATQVSKGSVLVVISVSESEVCRSNLLSNTLNQNDGYSFSTVINVPAKSVEPSNVTLSFQNKTADERETMDDSQSQTVKATLIGTARKENIAQHVCRASFPPSTAVGFDSSTATLDICTTPQLIVSHPVENIAVLPPGPYHKDSRVTCKAEGYPSPTFKWIHLKSGDVVDGDTLVITGEAGDKYECTATNTVKGKATSQSRTIDVVSLPGCGPGCIGGIIGGILAIIVIGAVSFFVYKRFCAT